MEVQMPSVQDVLFDCFWQKKDCRVEKVDGTVVTLTAASLNIFSKEEVIGVTPEMDQVAIPYAEIKEVNAV